jgi:hypothetical protein
MDEFNFMSFHQGTDGHIFLESFSPVYKHAHDFLITISEVIFDKKYLKFSTICFFVACKPSGIHSRIQADIIFTVCGRVCWLTNQ